MILVGTGTVGSEVPTNFFIAPEYYLNPKIVSKTRFAIHTKTYDDVHLPKSVQLATVFCLVLSKVSSIRSIRIESVSQRGGLKTEWERIAAGVKGNPPDCTHSLYSIALYSVQLY